MIQKYIDLGKKMYRMNNSREVRRLVVFVIRCMMNQGRMEQLFSFFSKNEVLRDVAEVYPFALEQPTRAFFYNQSTFDERIQLMKQHMTYITEHLTPQAVHDIYSERHLELWCDKNEEEPLAVSLMFEPGQRKEGLLDIMLRLGDEALYQIVFWIAKNKKNEWSMWIGAMQGPNMDNAKDVIKRITKRCHAYRTKNLVLYATQAVARAMGLSHIYAVTNYGYYANNHVRVDRKLKTSFSDFWLEAGGHPTEDKRFDELPLIEPRKTMEEVPTRKRAVYRKRFQMLDEIDDVVLSSMKKYMSM